MSKNLFQDMVKAKRERNGLDHIKRQNLSVDPLKKEITEKTKGRYSYWLVAIASIIFFLFALSYLFSSATITVNPKRQELVLNENLSAIKDSKDSLPFDLVVIAGEENKMVETAEEKEISQKAEGTVVIYNTFSSATQKLDINTRLEGSNDKIYKTKKAIVIPGMTGGGKPGSVEVEIYGAEAGALYNSDPLDFKIFGFKGTSKYSKFYGRSKGSITGGLKGKYPFVPDSQKTKIINELKASLETKLFQKAIDQIPDGFVLFKDAIFLDIDDEKIDLTSVVEDKIPFTLKGTLYGILFNESKLTQKIVENNVEKYDGSAVYIPNIKNLTFSYSNASDISLGDVKNIDFHLSGATEIVWKLDVNKFTADLSSKSKNDLKQILLQYPAIESAKFAMSPFWKRSFPDKIKNIKVIVNYPE